MSFRARAFVYALSVAIGSACVDVAPGSKGSSNQGVGGQPVVAPGAGGAVPGLPGGSGGSGGTGGSGGNSDAQPDGTDAARGDAGRADTSAPPDQSGSDVSNCSEPNVRDATLEGYQSDIVARLAGQLDIAPGVRLPNRASPGNRAQARSYLENLIRDLGLTPEEHAYGSGVNVFIRLPATTGSAETVVLGAHYDSVPAGPGANDNATGVAAVMGTARFAMRLTCRSRNLIFVLFDEEEVGLVGSKRFAAKLKTEGIVVHSVHTIDQMGWDANGDRLIELELPDSGLRERYERAVQELGAAIPLRTTDTMTTDHASFRPNFPAIGLSEGYRSGDTTPHYHKPGDTFPTVNFAYLASTTILLNQVTANLLRQ